MSGSTGELTPDYAKPTAQVYVEFLRHVTDEKKQLLLDGSNGIGLSLRKTDRIPGLPYWAVDYSYKELEGSFRDYSHCTRSADSAASTTISSTLDPMILSTQGAFLDTVNSFLRVHMPAVTKSGWRQGFDFVQKVLTGSHYLHNITHQATLTTLSPCGTS
jgi:hypothetical protein